MKPGLLKTIFNGVTSLLAIGVAALGIANLQK